MPWQIDSSHTTVEFGVRHMMVASVRGYFRNVSGTMELDEQDPARSRVEAVIDAASIDTRDAGRDAHLRAPDFLDVERFPAITFRSRRVEPLGGARYRVVGDLTMRGVTREVVLDAEYAGQMRDPYGNLRAGFSATTMINRKDFGVSWGAILETGGLALGDEVTIRLDLEAIRQEMERAA